MAPEEAEEDDEEVREPDTDTTVNRIYYNLVKGNPGSGCSRWSATMCRATTIPSTSRGAFATGSWTNPTNYDYRQSYHKWVTSKHFTDERLAARFAHLLSAEPYTVSVGHILPESFKPTPDPDTDTQWT